MFCLRDIDVFYLTKSIKHKVLLPIQSKAQSIKRAYL